MTICRNCVLSDRFPRIRFDENGVCNYCRAAREAPVGTEDRQSREQKFRKLVDEVRSKNAFDCVLAYSGGKDSTYTAYLLTQKYGLRVLAFSYDNWFQSATTYQNIRKVVERLNIHHINVLPAWDAFRRIVNAAIGEKAYSPKTLERASTICTTCLALIRFYGFRLTIEQRIPFLVFGLSPGQAPASTAVFKTNPKIIRAMQDAIYQPLRKRLGDAIDPFFLEDAHFEREDAFPYSINPLAFEDYREAEVLRVIATLGWEKPVDTDANSTNCLLNALANKTHMDRYGYNPYQHEIAELVRRGCLPRDEGLRRLQAPFPEEQIEGIRRKLQSDPGTACAPSDQTSTPPG